MSVITILFVGWGVVCIAVVDHIDGHYCLRIVVKYVFDRGMVYCLPLLFYFLLDDSYCSRLHYFVVMGYTLYMYCFSEWKWSCAGFCYHLYISVLPLKILFSRGVGWKPINLYYPATFVCLFKTVICISISICCDHHRVQWLEVIVRFVYIGGIVNIIKT